MFKKPFSQLLFSRKPFGGAVSPPVTAEAVSRHFTHLAAAAGSCYSVPLVIIESAENFVYEVDLMPATPVFHILGNSGGADANNGDSVAINSGGWLGFGVASIPRANTGWTSDKKLHHLKIERVNGNTINITIDGALDGSGIYTGPIKFNRLGGKFGGSTAIASFSGVYANAKLSVEGVERLNLPFNGPGINAIEKSLSGPDASRVNLTKLDSLLYHPSANGNWKTDNLWVNPIVGAGGSLITITADGFVIDTPSGDFVHIYVNSLNTSNNWVMGYDIDLESGALQYTTNSSGGDVTGNDITTSGKNSLARSLPLIGFKRRYSGSVGGSKAKATITKLGIYSTIEVVK